MRQRSKKMSLENWISRDEGVMNGQAVFRGTRVPVAVLFDNLQAGQRLEEILADYPAIPADAAAAVLSYALRRILTEAGDMSEAALAE